MATPWSDINLCTFSEVEDEHGSLAALASKGDSNYTETLTKIFETVKKDIATWIIKDVPDMLARRGDFYPPFDQYLSSVGYSYNTLDNLLNTIGNPEVLNRTALKGVAYYLWKRRLTSGAFGVEVGTESEQKQTKTLKDEFRQQYDDEAYVQLWFDLDGNDEVTDNERLRTHNTFWRS